MLKLNRSSLYLLVLALVLIGTQVYAHESRPILLNFTEIQPKIFQVLWKMPQGGLIKGDLYPIFPQDCVDSQNVTVKNFTHVKTHNQILTCDTGLFGKKISIHDLDKNIGLSALIRINFLNGQAFSHILLPTAPNFIVPQQQSQWNIIKSYMKFGILHIWQGVDHLLFIFCLLLIIPNNKKLLWTITAFTLAHSITLSLATLSLFTLPSPLVETCIALSIVFLAAEIYKNQQQSLIYHKPYLVAFGFGLLHGFGFADVLLSLGLPKTEIFLGLFSFNLGIEVGQILFIGLCLVLLSVTTYIIKKISLNNLQTLAYNKLIALVIGSIAAFWSIERFSSIVFSI